MDTWVNPETRDYVHAGGDLMRSAAGGLATAAYLRLVVPLGSYWGNPSLGSRLHELEREKDLTRVEVLARQYAQAALDPLVADGRARSIEVSTERQPGRLALLITLMAADDTSHSFTHFVRVA